MNLLLCDDDREELDISSRILKECHMESVLTINAYTNPCDALEAACVNHNFFDICILDILMPEMSGLELAQKLRKQGYEGKIVFLTTENSFAAESYDVEAFGYLLKPIEQPMMQSMLDKIVSSKLEGDHNFFMVQSRSVKQKVFFHDLTAVEVNGHNLFFHMINGDRVSVYATLESFLDILLSDSRMVRIQRSYIVNMDYITNFTAKRIVLKNGLVINISQRYGNFEDRYLQYIYGRR